jgi:hypothetical protein
LILPPSVWPSAAPDSGGRLAAHLLRFLDGVFEGFLDGVRKLLDGLGQIFGLDLETEGQHATRGHELRLAQPEHGARRIR